MLKISFFFVGTWPKGAPIYPVFHFSCLNLYQKLRESWIFFSASSLHPPHGKLAMSALCAHCSFTDCIFNSIVSGPLHSHYLSDWKTCMSEISTLFGHFWAAEKGELCFLTGSTGSWTCGYSSCTGFLWPSVMGPNVSFFHGVQNPCRRHWLNQLFKTNNTKQLQYRRACFALNA